jgi:hypothetical protein
MHRLKKALNIDVNQDAESWSNKPGFCIKLFASAGKYLKRHATTLAERAEKDGHEAGQHSFYQNYRGCHLLP